MTATTSPIRQAVNDYCRACSRACCHKCVFEEWTDARRECKEHRSKGGERVRLYALNGRERTLH
jgi:DNA topoisomerase IB